MTDAIDFDDFLKVDIRVGRIVRAEPYPEARKPAIKLWVDFGEALGVKKSCAQLTRHSTPESLIGRQVLDLEIEDERDALRALGYRDDERAGGDAAEDARP